MTSRAELTVAIVSWQCREELLACLASLATSQSCHVQTIVVDNGSTDGTVAAVRARYPDVTVVEAGRNLGFARACNLGAERAEAPWLLLLNPDTVVPAGSLRQWLDLVRNVSRLGACGPMLLNANGTLQPSVRRLPTAGTLVTLLLKLHRVLPRLLDGYLYRSFSYREAAQVPQVMGAALLTPTDVYRRLGGLDQRYHIWFEDVDYCARVAEAGLEVRFEPRVSIAHLGGQSFSRRRTLWQQWQLVRSAVTYSCLRHGWRCVFVCLAAPLSLALGLVSAAVPQAVLRRARRNWYR